MKSTKRDTLDCLISLAVEGCGDDDVAAFLALDDSAVEFSAEHTRKINALIRKSKRRTRSHGVRRVLSIAAVALLAVMAAAFLTIMSVTALRDAVLKTIFNRYEDYMSFQYVADEPDETFDLTKTIETVYKPTYTVEGLEEEVVLENEFAVVIDYYIGDEWQFSYQQRLVNNSEHIYDSETAEIQELLINGCEAKLITYEKNDTKYLFWSDNRYIYKVETDLDLSTLFEIVDSIKPIS